MVRSRLSALGSEICGLPLLLVGSSTRQANLKLLAIHLLNRPQYEKVGDQGLSFSAVDIERMSDIDYEETKP